MSLRKSVTQSVSLTVSHCTATDQVHSEGDELDVVEKINQSVSQSVSLTTNYSDAEGLYGH